MTQDKINDGGPEQLAQPKAWEAIKADLKVQVWANDCLVAEAVNPVLWAQILSFIGDFRGQS